MLLDVINSKKVLAQKYWYRQYFSTALQYCYCYRQYYIAKYCYGIDNSFHKS